MAVKTIPDGFHAVTPYLVVSGVPRLIDFLKNTFGAQEIMRMPGPDGAIMHAEVRIGDSIVMMGEAGGQWQPMPTNLYVYVNDCDATYQRALRAGGTAVQELKDQFYGDRSGTVKDPCGNMWSIATHKEDIAPEEMDRRMKEAMKQRSAAG